jgi:predicted YcjX-like family ATPase
MISIYDSEWLYKQGQEDKEKYQQFLAELAELEEGKRQQLVQAWEALQSVPSYVETNARKFASEV